MPSEILGKTFSSVLADVVGNIFGWLENHFSLIAALFGVGENTGLSGEYAMECEKKVFSDSARSKNRGQ
jgi:hypothetical protein